MKPSDNKPSYLYGVSPASTDAEIREMWPAVSDDADTLGDAYEIRLSGNAAGIVWEDWFDDATVKTLPRGITLLKTRAADQAAMYGMLSRLRELGLTLESVKRLDPPTRGGGWWASLWREMKRVNWIVVALYLLAGGVVVPFGIFFARVMGAALGLAIMFGALGGLAVVAQRWDRGPGWAVVAGLNALGALICMTIFLANDAGLPTEMALGFLFLIPAGVGVGVYMWWRARQARRAMPLLPDGGAVVRITVRGRLESGTWAERLEGMTLEARDDGTTVLIGPVGSQARLYALLATLRDLALPLVSVVSVRPLNDAAPRGPRPLGGQ